MAKKLVVIGGVAAGPKAAAKARRCDPTMEITIVDRDKYVSYGGCGMPYLIGGEIESKGELMETPGGVVRTPPFFKKSKNIDVLARHEALRIDRTTKKVEVKNLKTGEVFALDYDKLVLATGSSCKRPAIPGVDLANVHVLACLSDAEQILKCLRQQKPKRAVCIGAGLVTLETATGFASRGVEVTIVARSDQVLFRFDYEIGAQVRKELERNNVTVYTSETVEELIGDGDGKVTALRTDQRTIETDLVLIAKGVEPNAKLAEEAGLALGETGAIKVDSHLCTSDPDIYAAGDCVESRHLVTGKMGHHPRGSTANKQGRVVGVNVTGGDDEFPGVLGNVVLKVFDLNVGKVGLTEKGAREHGYDIETVIAPAPDKAHFYADAKRIIVKLVAERPSGRLLGAQVVGAGDAIKRIDVASAMITCGANVDTLSKLDLGYAPPYSSAMDPIITAANIMRNKLEGRAAGVSPVAVKEKLDRGDDFVLLDVRDDDEYEEEHIPNTTLVPLPQLKERLDELPKDKEIIAFCAISLRAYAACLTLQAKGFQNVKFMDGGMAAWPYETEP